MGTADIPTRDPEVPHLHPLAYHGPVGQMTKALAPTTEADPVGVLVCLLALSGAYLGPDPFFVMGGAEHPAKVWPLLMGSTGLGRKGTAAMVARTALITSFSSSFQARVTSGLSSGEGLIEAFTNLPAEDDADGLAEINDRRLVVVEPEFGTVLGRGKREGNTLSEVSRALWDGGQASVLNRRKNSLECSDAHLVIVGQITPAELTERLSDRDLSGGLVNRYMPIYVRSPHALPDEHDAADVEDLALGIRQRLDVARDTGRWHRTTAASELWRDVYEALRADDDGGRLGETTVRGPAYTMRLALLLAVLDCRLREIDREHVLAAAALWEYAAASARKVLGHRRLYGRDRLAAALRCGPLTKTEISERIFARNEKADDIQAWLNSLIDEGDVSVEVERDGKPGRPAQRYYWTGVPSLLREVIEQADAAKYEQNEGINVRETCA